MDPFGVVRKAVQSANDLSSLGVTAVWALMFMLLGAWSVWREKRAQAMADKWSDIRTEEAKADMLMAQAIQQIAQEVARLKIIVDERLPRRAA